MSRQRAIVSLASRLMRASTHGLLAPSALYGRAVQPSAVAGVISARNQLAISRGFTASSLRADESEKELADIVVSESDNEKASYVKPEELKAGPPEPFKLVENDSNCEMVLTREFEAEKISVTFVANDEEQHEMSEDHEAPEDEEEEFKETMFFTVDVTKPSGTSLSFDCVTDGADIEIRGVSLLGEGADDSAAYIGPDYEFLDEQMHEKFEQYLEARGVDLELAVFMMDLSQDKEQREYMGWLVRMQKFLKE